MITDKQIVYEWFKYHYDNGNPVNKDEFLSHRELWDGLQTALSDHGFALTHDPIKNLVANMDKAGWLGGIALGRSFEEQYKEGVEARRINRKETGHPDGTDGVLYDIARYAEAMNNQLKDYYSTPYWGLKSKTHKENANWTCELCLKQHPRNSPTLVTHHKSYKLENGECALYHETERELMALCSKPCHQLADIARYIKVGRIDPQSLEVALSPLFNQVR